MLYSSLHKQHASSGFTLVEILVIAPIVLLAIGGFISLMVAMVGDVMVTRDNNTMIYEAQDTLRRIENDVRISTAFLTTTGTLISPQGSNSGTAAFTNNSNTLILNSFVTDQNPLNPSREIIYFKDQPNSCGGTTKIFNNVLYSKVIYFINNGSLWRRTTISPFNTSATVDSQTVCTAPWQQDSCSPGYVAARCKTNDIEVMKNVTELDVEYYDSPSSTSDMGTGAATGATTIKVTVKASKQTSTKTIDVIRSLRATRINTVTVPS
ncbi:MAG TPA: hypothetical protein VF281_01170 [Candidatus Saccharimonadales bacterium]